MRNTYSVNEAKQEIKNSISVYMKKDETGRYILPEYKKNPFYLMGAPGIGKTEMVKQIAQELDLGFFATSVTHHTRNSMLGLPVITEQDWGKYTEYTMPDILAQVEKRQLAGEKEGILLIDEFASMSEALVAPMLAFLQSKSVGNHTLPEGWVIVLCSNPPEFNETAREFDAAVMDRVRLMNIEYSKEDFLKYARTHKMHPIILDYLKQQDEGGYICRRTGGKSEIVTARGWENLSDCLYGYEKLEKDISEKLIYQFIKSEKTATEFYRFYLTNKTVFSVKEVEGILKGEGMEKSLGKIRKYSYMKKLQSLNYISGIHYRMFFEILEGVKPHLIVNYIRRNGDDLSGIRVIYRTDGYDAVYTVDNHVLCISGFRRMCCQIAETVCPEDSNRIKNLWFAFSIFCDASGNKFDMFRTSLLGKVIMIHSIYDTDLVIHFDMVDQLGKTLHKPSGIGISVWRRTGDDRFAFDLVFFLAPDILVNGSFRQISDFINDVF